MILETKDELEVSTRCFGGVPCPTEVLKRLDASAGRKARQTVILEPAGSLPGSTSRKAAYNGAVELLVVEDGLHAIPH
jgi:hypothetical protein